MTSVIDKNKKQELGIYYTPEMVVDFIYGILNILKKKEDKKNQRWESRKPRAHYPSVIDPACGEGIFLKKAIESGFTGYHPTHKVPYIFGVDIDCTVVEQWKQLSILDLFKGNREIMKKHFFGQNGLLELPDHKLIYKKRGDGLFRFDTVVGNPPYGGVGLGETELTDNLIIQLAKFEVLPENVKTNLLIVNSQTDLFNSNKQLSIKPDAKQRIKTFSIEILFLERFIQLAKPGGWIAIIIPDGILANSNLHYVREFIAEKAKVLAIISLPRDTFKLTGTSAKTSIIFLQKHQEDNKKDINYPLFLASINKLEKKYFEEIINSYNNFYNYDKL